MDSTSRRSFDAESDHTHHQRTDGFEDTMKSDHSGMMDLSKQGIFVERTLALIKPDVVQKADEIETILLQHGFTVLHVNFVYCRDLNRSISLIVEFHFLETTTNIDFGAMF